MALGLEWVGGMREFCNWLWINMGQITLPPLRNNIHYPRYHIGQQALDTVTQGDGAPSQYKDRTPTPIPPLLRWLYSS